MPPTRRRERKPSLDARLGVVRSLVLAESLTALGIVAAYVPPSVLACCLLPLPLCLALRPALRRLGG